MAFSAIVALAAKGPVVLAQLTALALAVSAFVGGVGTALEKLGEALKSPKLVAVGQRLEAIGTDVPKLVRGSRLTAIEAEAKDAVEASTKSSGL